MGTLYIDRKDAELDYREGQILVREAGEKPWGFPGAGIERLIVIGNVRIQSRMLTHLAEQGTSLLFLEGRGLRRTALAGGPRHGDAARRLGQYRLCSDPNNSLRWARLLVHSRAAALTRFYRRLTMRRPDLRLPMLTASRQLLEKLPLVRHCTNLESLRGLEGSIAAIHFTAYTQLFPEAAGFSHRNRRPPKDPVNAALSLGYTLSHSDAVRACLVNGLDPMLGTLHQPAHGRESLASDLNELARLGVEQLVWRPFSEKSLRPEAFERSDAGVFLNKPQRQVFYSAYETQAGNIRRVLQRAARALARQCSAPA